MSISFYLGVLCLIAAIVLLYQALGKHNAGEKKQFKVRLVLGLAMLILANHLR